MLTEYLCTIIEQNEERKAEKLTELLKKLKIDPMDTQGDSLQNQEGNENHVSSSTDIIKDAK